MDLLNCRPLEWHQHEAQFLALLQDEQNWKQIPLLNVEKLHDLEDGKLVRFRGMIQDMHGPEIYIEKYEVVNNETKERRECLGKFLDIANCQPNETVDFDDSSASRGERQTYVAISVPATNNWVLKLEETQNKVEINKTEQDFLKNKRSLDEMETDESEISEQSSSRGNKRQCRNPTVTPIGLNQVSQESLLNFPIADSNGKGCLIKIYENFNQIKLNEVFEFLGFLSVDPGLATCDNDEEMNDIEFQIHNPPPSLIPRIHCIAFKKLTHYNPLLSNAEKMNPRKMQIIRKELSILFTQLLCGDGLAAEYLIYHLISEVYGRKDSLALGKFCLNIFGLPKFEGINFVTELYSFIEMLVTKSHYFGMSLKSMNELAFIPKKDYTSNRLTSSILQLSANTHLVIDETKLTSGRLNESGIGGVKALENIIKNQKSFYDFTYYQLDFECDIPCLILSEGRSMLPSDCHIILKLDELHLKTYNEILQAAKHFLKPELLNDIRTYLTSARLVEYGITDEIQQMVVNDFVNMRQNGKIMGDDLHNLLVLARLVCVSQGKTILDEESWRQTCELDENRRNRLYGLDNQNVI